MLPQFFYYPIARYVCVHVNQVGGVCVCVCVCVCVHTHTTLHACIRTLCLSSPFSWYEPPKATYADVNIFGLQTVFVVVSVHVQVDK